MISLYFVFPQFGWNLNYAELETLTNEECRNKSRSDAPIYDCCTLCTIHNGLAIGLVNGDSGGPLTYGNTLIGIASWGTIPSCIGKPDGYTRVSEYLDWIEQSIQIAENRTKQI